MSEDKPRRKKGWQEFHAPAGDGHKASGPGWGGAANRPGNHGPGPGRPTNAQRAAKLPEVERVKEEMRLVLYNIATDDGGPEMARIAAADKLMDRTEGKVEQKSNITGQVGLEHWVLESLGQLAPPDAPVEGELAGGADEG